MSRNLQVECDEKRNEYLDKCCQLVSAHDEEGKDGDGQRYLG